MALEREHGTLTTPPSFWQLLQELGVEHDRQMGGLLSLVRELRVELSIATGLGDEDLASFDVHGPRLHGQVAMNGAKEPAIQPQHCVASPLYPAQEECSGPSEPDCQTSEAAARHKADESTAIGTRSVNPSLASSPSLGEGTEESPRCKLREGAVAAEMPLTNSAEDGDGGGEADRPCVGKSKRSTHTLAHLVQRPEFEAMVGCLILANTLIMMFETQYVGLVAGYSTGLPTVENDPEVSWRGATVVFLVLDRVFTVIFAAELLLRFVALRCALFKQLLNWMDISSVLVSVLQWAFEEIPVNPTVLRLIRVARLVRGVRFLKLSKVLASLNILLKCIRASINILFWSLCLLMMIQCIIGMVASQFAHEYIIDVSQPESKRQELFLYYGTFTRSFVTMFEVHMANWIKPCRILMETLGEFWGNLFIFYRCVMGFALMSVIGAVFVQQTMSIVQNDNDIMIVKKQREAEIYNSKLKSLFETLDKNSDAMLTRTEFDQVKEDPVLKDYMNALDINPDDLEGLFNLLDSGDGLVSVEEFLMGATRVRGTAKSIDIAHLLASVDKLQRSLMELQQKLCLRGAAEPLIV